MGQSASIPTCNYRHNPSAHRRARTTNAASREASTLEDQQTTCFAGAQHLGGGVLSRFVPPAKSQSIDHYIGDIGRDLTDPPRSHRSNRLLS